MALKAPTLLLSASLALCDTGMVAADELTDVYSAILANPTSTELNLEYALIAENRGEYRKALAAYERILANDPGNVVARRGLQRVRRIIQPPVTYVTVNGGTGFETNPRHKKDPKDGEFLAFGQATMRDERTLGTTRWRTNAGIYADVYEKTSDLDYASAWANIGPIYDIPGTLVAAVPQIGGAATILGGRYYYSEVNLTTTFESYLDGAYQWARIRGGYRVYDSYWTASEGFYAEATGRWLHPDIFSDDDAFWVSPWFRWSDIDGSVLDAQTGRKEPGKYIAGGARFQYDTALTEWLALGLFVGLSDRLYDADTAPDGDQRQDFLVQPGIVLLFDDLLGHQTDLKVEYEYTYADSNDPKHDYQNHEVMLSVSKRM